MCNTYIHIHTHDVKVYTRVGGEDSGNMTTNTHHDTNVCIIHILYQSQSDDDTSQQIQEQEAEPQQIVAQGLLSCLQYPVPIKSSTEDLTRPTL